VILAGVLLGVAAFVLVWMGWVSLDDGYYGLAILLGGIALVCVGVALLGWQAVIATSIVLACASVWAWQCWRTYPRRQVAGRWFLCPYCNSRVKPGAYTASGSQGAGHWACVD
jgi:hypothetical protein